MPTLTYFGLGARGFVTRVCMRKAGDEDYGRCVQSGMRKEIHLKRLGVEH